MAGAPLNVTVKDSASTTVASGVTTSTGYFYANLPAGNYVLTGNGYTTGPHGEGAHPVIHEMTAPELNQTNLANYPGVAADGVTDDTAIIQIALDAAAALNVILKARGTFAISSTITINSNIDFSEATFNYTGATGTAIRVGNSTPYLIRQRDISLPRVINTTKTTTGWGTVTGSVGIEFINLYSCRLDVPYIKNFETGLKLTAASSNGTSYNDIYLGHLDNNKVNMLLAPAATGWVNQNNTWSGRCSHDSSEGVQVAGTRHVTIALGTNIVNGNSWWGTSLETPDVLEYHVDCRGQYNFFERCRWENTGGAAHRRIFSGSAAKGNRISYGYNSGQITQVTADTAIPFDVDSENRNIWSAGTITEPALTVENSTSVNAPVLRHLPPGVLEGGLDPATKWTLQTTATSLAGKQTNDTYPRFKLDASTGRLYGGDGTVDPTVKFIGMFGDTIGWDGAHFYAATDNTYDIGGFAGNRPRYIRAGQAVVTRANTTATRAAASTAGAGAFYYDTTLNKPVFSDGTNWRDATGVIV